VLNQLLNVGWLNARHMACARLAPVPLPCAAGKDLGVLEGRIALDLYVAPGKLRDTWGNRFCLAHVFTEKSLALHRKKRHAANA
jgi:hypothetical protein